MKACNNFLDSKTTANGGTVKLGTSRWSGSAMANTTYGKVVLNVTKIQSKPSGSFTIKFTTTDPKTAEKISVSTGNIVIAASPISDTITKTSIWNVPAGVKSVDIQLIGGGGDGGGAATKATIGSGISRPGGKGSNGDKVVGTYVIPAGVTSLLIKLLPAGLYGSAKSYTGSGGFGGNGIALFKGSAPDVAAVIATAAGGGGGGSGGYTGNGNIGGSTTVATAYTTGVLSGGSAGDQGSGGGGGGGGTASVNSLSVSGQPGGGGGKSYVPNGSGFTRTAAGGGLGGAGGLATVGKVGTLYETLYVWDDNDDFSTVLVPYIIGDNITKGYTTWSWTNVAFGAGDYIVNFQADDGFSLTSIKIDGKTMPVALNSSNYAILTELSFTVSDNWNREIIATCAYNALKLNYSNTKTGFSATIRPKGTTATDSNYVWTSRYPSSYKVGDGSWGTPGENARAVLTYTPTGDQSTSGTVITHTTVVDAPPLPKLPIGPTAISCKVKLGGTKSDLLEVSFTDNNVSKVAKYVVSFSVTYLGGHTYTEKSYGTATIIPSTARSNVTLTSAQKTALTSNGSMASFGTGIAITGVVKNAAKTYDLTIDKLTVTIVTTPTNTTFAETTTVFKTSLPTPVTSTTATVGAVVSNYNTQNYIP